MPADAVEIIGFCRRNLTRNDYCRPTKKPKLPGMQPQSCSRNHARLNSFGLPWTPRSMLGRCEFGQEDDGNECGFWTHFDNPDDGPPIAVQSTEDHPSRPMVAIQNCGKADVITKQQNFKAVRTCLHTVWTQSMRALTQIEDQSALLVFSCPFNALFF